MNLLSLTWIKKSDLRQIKIQNKNLNEAIIWSQSVIQEIERRQWESAIEKVNQQKDNALHQGLLSLAENLRNFWTQEDNRNWASQGLLKVSAIVNQNQHDQKKLADELISTIVKYSKANQGAIFLADNSDPKNIFLEMVGCYAYERKKFIEKRIGIDEGLLGQCYMEGDPVYITNLPSDYIKITSGLGEALPRSIMIIPLTANGRKVGMLELAFFDVLERYEREFLISVGEAVANSFVNIQTNAKTLSLLNISESMTADLKKREEELNQNMEEMMAIQEEMSRKNDELERAKREIELISVREQELIESKLATQQNIHDTITNTLKLKIERLQKELMREKEMNAKMAMAL